MFEPRRPPQQQAPSHGGAEHLGQHPGVHPAPTAIPNPAAIRGERPASAVSSAIPPWPWASDIIHGDVVRNQSCPHMVTCSVSPAQLSGISVTRWRPGTGEVAGTARSRWHRTAGAPEPRHAGTPQVARCFLLADSTEPFQLVPTGHGSKRPTSLRSCLRLPCELRLGSPALTPQGQRPRPLRQGTDPGQGLAPPQRHLGGPATDSGDPLKLGYTQPPSLPCCSFAEPWENLRA